MHQAQPILYAPLAVAAARQTFLKVQFVPVTSLRVRLSESLGDERLRS